MEDLDSPEKEDEFPGLYAGSSKSKKEDGDFNDDKSKRKEKNKDKGYATLMAGGESDDDDCVSPTKSAKKLKFKFASKSKEKREKSRDKEKIESKDKELLDVKDRKKEKKEKEKKDKKTKQTVGIDEPLELGLVHPIFGVSLGLAIERSRCHDSINLPLVVRDCIDYLQEFGVTSENIYKADPVKSRLQQLKKLYNNRDSKGASDLDVPTACGLLKLFLRELPEPILTTDLIIRFEEISAISDVQQQERELKELVDQLPSSNKTLLQWISTHLESVTENEKVHKMNAQSLAMLLSPTLQMSHRLFGTILCHCRTLFQNGKLPKYVPPLTGSSTFPESPDEILQELRKQESLLSQIHSEMNAGFVTKKREEQLWEVQRIITQLKRKLRTFEKKTATGQKVLCDQIDGGSEVMSKLLRSSDEESSPKTLTWSESKMLSQQTSPEHPYTQISDSAQLTMNDYGHLTLPKSHPDYLALLRLQLEYFELMQWSQSMQKRIRNERLEMFHLKQQLDATPKATTVLAEVDDDSISQLAIQNSILENTYSMLKEKLIEENKELIRLQVEIQLKKFGLSADNGKICV